MAVYISSIYVHLLLIQVVKSFDDLQFDEARLIILNDDAILSIILVVEGQTDNYVHVKLVQFADFDAVIYTSCIKHLKRQNNFHCLFRVPNQNRKMEPL